MGGHRRILHTGSPYDTRSEHPAQCFIRVRQPVLLLLWHIVCVTTSLRPLVCPVLLVSGLLFVMVGYTEEWGV